MVHFILSLLFTSSVYASEPLSQIMLNEVQIEPVQKVEIVNQGAESVDLSGWHIDDDGGTTYVTIPTATILQPNSCIIIEGKFNLNKSSADTVHLFDNSLPPTSELAQPVDAFTYDTSPGESISFQRIPDGSTDWITAAATLGLWNESLENCQIILSPTPTMSIVATPSLIPTPTGSLAVTNIRISEVMTYPDSGETEWVELYNPNDFEVTLSNWYIDDVSDGGASPKKFTLLLPAKGYGVYSIISGIFNNGGDSIRLLNAENTLLDSISYTSSTKGLTLGRTDMFSDNLCIQEATKGYENESCITEEKEITKESLQITPPFSSIAPFQIEISATSRYAVHTNLPEISHKEDPKILGTEHHMNTEHASETSRTLFLLPSAYSLLSIISLAVRMKLQ